MASFNKVMLMGNLTRDPELRFTANGSAVASFGLAVNRKFKQGDEWVDDVCFVDITVWGKQGENCAEYLSKGRPAFIEGYLKFSEWDDKNDGKKRNKLGVVANTVQFLGSPKDSPGGSSIGQAPVPSNEDDVPF
jgi:single-strand DNA-binding protein